jgi:hypothetical protein
LDWLQRNGKIVYFIRLRSCDLEDLRIFIAIRCDLDFKVRIGRYKQLSVLFDSSEPRGVGLHAKTSLDGRDRFSRL